MQCLQYNASAPRIRLVIYSYRVYVSINIPEVSKNARTLQSLHIGLSQDHSPTEDVIIHNGGDQSGRLVDDSVCIYFYMQIYGTVTVHGACTIYLHITYKPQT